MQALTILKQLNASGGRKVPDDAPAGFVPRRYAEYLTQARRSGAVTTYRHYRELCVLLAVRDGLRSAANAIDDQAADAPPANQSGQPSGPRKHRWRRAAV